MAMICAVAPTMDQRRAAARRYGRLVDDIARQYRNPITGKPLSGAALLLKLDIGEGVGTSSAGARGETQFMPQTRRNVLRATGGRVDPWRSLDEAYEAAAMHLRGELGHRPGLEGYNPGGGRRYVDYILRQRVGDPGARRGRGGGRALLDAASSGGEMPDGSEGMVTLLAALGERQAPQPRGSAGVPLPEWAARPVLPEGFQLPVSGGGPTPQQGPGMDALLELVRTAGGDVPTAARETGDGGGGQGAAGSGRARGRVTLRAGADRPGVATSRSILRVAEMVAGQHGKPLVVGTGTAHSRMTRSGNVSEHWDGRAVDIPASGRELTEMGRNALIALGVPAKRAAEMARRGGIFNVPYGKRRRVQVIFNTDDHWDHLHLGVTAA